jgi:ribosomal protein L40E
MGSFARVESKGERQNRVYCTKCGTLNADDATVCVHAALPFTALKGKASPTGDTGA